MSGHITPEIMTRTTFLLAALLFTVVQATAQEPQPLEPEPTGTCFVETDVQTWQGLGLTDDQLAKVKSMQTACKTDCAVTPETKGTDADISGAVLKRYNEQLQALLSPEQYAKWTKWCADRPDDM
jgi:hypothetical protein